MRLDRRSLFSTGAAALAFTGLAKSVVAQGASETYINEVEGYGPLVSDPNGMLDLPQGFSYRILSQGGEAMSDGLVVPGQFDGMGCFALEGSRVALVRNHELRGRNANHRDWGPGGQDQALIDRLPVDKAYGTYKDGRPLPGGTTTLIYDMATGEVVSQHLSLAGTSTV